MKENHTYCSLIHITQHSLYQSRIIIFFYSLSDVLFLFLFFYLFDVDMHK